MASDSDPKSPPLQDGRFTSLRSSHMDPVFNLKLDGVGVDCAPPGQYPSSSTTPRSESPSVLFTFLYWVILGTRLGSSSRREVETQSNLQVCDRYNARLAKLLVLVCILAVIFATADSSLSSRALCYSLQHSSVLYCHPLAAGLTARNRSLFDCCHSQWRSLFPDNYFKLVFFVRAPRIF